MIRQHEHRCRKCRYTWWCRSEPCGKSGMRRDTLCGGGRCNQDVKHKKEKRMAPLEEDLFSGSYNHYGGTPPHVDTDTSRQAAIAVLPKVGKQQARVYEAFKVCGPSTDDQLSQATGLPLSSICARRNELCKMGLVQKTINRRSTRQGGTAIVWRLKQ